MLRAAAAQVGGETCRLRIICRSSTWTFLASERDTPRSGENLRPATLATIGILSVALLQSACIWVALTSGGEQVRMLRAAEAADCRRLGSTTSQTTDHVLIFARVDRTVNEEVRSLARNEAAQMGGDGIVPRGALEQGRQSFDVYQCSP